MIRRAISEDASELVFRLLFSSIFILLGGEHLLSDELMQSLMPAWLPAKRALSIAAGVLLIVGGSCIAAGFRVYWAASALAGFLVVVTLLVHVPGMLELPTGLSPDWGWLWDLFQRTNFIKNVCLLGVCFHFFYHEPGRFSLEQWLASRREGAGLLP